ncbi:MAG: peptide chain release factor 1 [Verrucomicrobia bacterium]|nr:MAG: peptide chain release factor 1 [Verrucomicrobiota bacterium]
MPSVPDIAPFVRRLEEIGASMAAPAFFSDTRRAARLSREHQKLRDLIEQFEQMRKIEKELKDTEKLSSSSETDLELKDLAEAELPELRERFAAFEKSVLVGMIPPDDSDSRNTIVEIRAGAGGDEASLFAGSLFRMYTRFAETRGWKVEQLNASLSDRGGYKEVIFEVRGEEVYKLLKFESGVHRVQRVPETEANGRIHTSTVTVAVLPEAEEVDIEIDPSDLEISVTRASGPGGQGVNTTDSAVQILHRPTGMIVTCADERSQMKNRHRALTVLRSRLLQNKQEEERAKYAENRRSQIGSGDRSERIRTYNFPQSRLTDHRIGLTLHSLPQIVEGSLDEVVDALQDADHAAKIEELTSRPSF